MAAASLRWYKPLMRRGGRIVVVVLFVGALALTLLLFPQPLFAYSFDYGRFRIWSDRPIDPAIVHVLRDAERRLQRSELDDPDAEFRIFFCNEPWRLWLFTRSAAVGGSADTLLSRNIYLRESDVAANRLIPPEGALADAEVRPLAYFIAHEATHVTQSRTFGRLMEWRYPDWLTEGHADFVAKGGAFDVAENRRLLIAGDPRLDYTASGLYRGYHLMFAHLVEEQGRPIRSLFEDPPDAAAVLRSLRQRPTSLPPNPQTG